MAVTEERRQLDRASRVERVVVGAVAAASLCWLASMFPKYLGRFSGDAMIHLTFAERITEGRWLEFNRGEASAGTTSLLWNIVESLVLALLPTKHALWVIWLGGFVAWLLMGLGVFILAGEFGARRLWAVAAALIAMCMPGTVANAFQGMEAGPFACAAVWASVFLVRLLSEPDRYWHWLGLSATLSPCVWLRPEGVILAGVVFVVLVADRRFTALAAAFVPAMLLGICLLALHHGATGRWLPGSGVARVAAARRDSLALHVGPLWLHGRVLVRVLAYGALLLPLPAVIVGGTSFQGTSSVRTARRAVALTVGVALAGYVLVMGAAHTGRYLLWVWALAIPCSFGTFGRSETRRAIAASLLFVAVGSAEVWGRTRDSAQTGGVSIDALVRSKERRVEATDALLEASAKSGVHAVRVAFTEVQARWGLDDRVAVDSIDGRTDSRVLPARFDDRGCPQLPVSAPRGVIFFESIQGTAPTCAFPVWVNSFESARAGAPDPCWRRVSVAGFGIGLVATCGEGAE